MPQRWSYGVTTVPARRDTLLPRTLASLAAAGFDAPRLFVDGAASGFGGFGLPVTYREPKVRTAGNWVLALYELYLRDPAATRYAVFQDDLVCCRNLRAYLDACAHPERGYRNLYTFDSNQRVAPGEGWFEAAALNPGSGFQTGRGALALAFDREGVLTLLSSRYLVERPQDAHRGHRAIDGGVVTAMNRAGWREWVHNPSLTQHTGAVSSMGNKPHRPAPSFRGEDWDALGLLKSDLPAPVQ